MVDGGDGEGRKGYDIYGRFSRRTENPSTPRRRSLLLDSQTKHDLLRLTVQPTRGPISRLGCAQKRKLGASPSVALCSVPRYRRVYIRCCRDVAWTTLPD